MPSYSATTARGGSPAAVPAESGSSQRSVATTSSGAAEVDVPTIAFYDAGNAYDLPSSADGP
jgi:hypothetical protein